VWDTLAAMGHHARDHAWREIERRVVAGELAPGARIDEDALADEFEVRVGAVREALSALERDGFVRGATDGGYTVAELSEVEVREAYPVAILLEGLALRETAAFPPEALARLRSINEDMAGSLGDPMRAATCDWAFHDELTGHCGNEQLLATLRPLKRMLLRYEHTYMSAEEFVDRSVGQHWRIVEALERGDTEAAAQVASANFRDSLPGILERLQDTSVQAPE
jgi:DNA-binding GntR family transcriptional regulator